MRAGQPPFTHRASLRAGDYVQVTIGQRGAGALLESLFDAHVDLRIGIDPVLLEFALGSASSWLWATTPQASVSVQLPPRKVIESAARSLYERVTARQKRSGTYGRGYSRRVLDADARFRTEARDLSRLLLGGIADQLSHDWRHKRLAIVATGALEALPFAALPSPTGTTTVPLIAQHEIVMIPSASVVDVLRREAASRQPATGTVAIVADPVFVRSDPRA